MLTVAAHRGPIQIINASWPVTREWVTGRAVADSAPVHIADLQALGQEFPHGQAMALRHGTRTVLSTPLLRDNVAIGAITLRRIEVRPFSAKQVALLQTFADQAVIAIENTRLFEEVQARTRELQQSLEYQTATSDVLKVISRSAFDLHTVLDTLNESAARLCGADTAIIRQREGDTYPLAATYGLTGPQRDHFAAYSSSPDRGSVFGRAILEGRTIHVPDVVGDPEYNRPRLQDFVQVRAALGVPLMRDGVPVGVFTLQWREPRPYSQREIELVTTFADQAVIAIENVRLFETVQARTRELSDALEQQTATSEVLQVINASPGDLAPVFEAMLAKATQLCNAKLGIMWSYDGEAFTIAAERGTPPPSTVFGDTLARPGPTTALGRVQREKRVLHIPDMMDEEAYRDGDPMRIASVDALGIRSWLGVPLLKEGKLLGVVTIYRGEVRPFSDKEIALLTSFAEQAVIAIENVAALRGGAGAHATSSPAPSRSCRLSSEVSHAVNSTLDLETVLNTIVAKAVQLSATDAGAIYVFSNLRQKFRLRSTYGMSEQFVEEFRNQKRIGLDESYYRTRADAAREPMQVPDLTSRAILGYSGPRAERQVIARFSWCRF